MDHLNRAAEVLARLAAWIVIALTLGITAVMLAQVVFRYGLNDSLQWSEEVSVWLMIWMTFVGGALLSARDDHMAVSIAWIPSSVQPWIVIGSKLLTILFLGFVIYYGLAFFDATFHRMSPSTGISTKWAKLALPVGSALMLLLTLRSLFLDVVALKAGDLARFEPRDGVSVD